MTRDELKDQLANLEPGQRIVVPYDIYELLFPPGEPDQDARAACWAFAKQMACSIYNVSEDQTVWFFKNVYRP